MKHRDFVRNQRMKAVATAEDVVGRRMGIIAGARILSGLRFEVDVSDNDNDFITFFRIDAETDTFPLAQERVHWSSAALREKDMEMKCYEDRNRKFAMNACENIIKKWKNFP